MKARELNSAQAFWIAGCSAAAGAAVVLISGGRVPWLIKSLWTEEAAGWAAAVGTLIAVWVALTASNREHARAVQLRNEEWTRADEKERLQTVALAHAFHRELFFADGDLQVVIARTSEEAVAESVADVRDFLVLTDPLPRFEVMSRFANQLGGFTVDDATAILHALGSWEPFRNAAPKGLMDADPEVIVELAFNCRHAAAIARRNFRDLQLNLECYFDPNSALVLSQTSRIVID